MAMACGYKSTVFFTSVTVGHYVESRFRALSTHRYVAVGCRREYAWENTSACQSMPHKQEPLQKHCAMSWRADRHLCLKTACERCSRCRVCERCCYFLSHQVTLLNTFAGVVKKKYPKADWCQILRSHKIRGFCFFKGHVGIMKKKKVLGFLNRKIAFWSDKKFPVSRSEGFENAIVGRCVVFFENRFLAWHSFVIKN